LTVEDRGKGRLYPQWGTSELAGGKRTNEEPPLSDLSSFSLLSLSQKLLKKSSSSPTERETTWSNQRNVEVRGKRRELSETRTEVEGERKSLRYDI